MLTGVVRIAIVARTAMRPRSSAFFRWAVVLGLGLAADASAQVKGPAAPESYLATIRYRIRADRDGRIIQYREMEKNLAAAGFKAADPDAGKVAQFDASAELTSGTVPSASALKLLDDPRVHTILLAPAGYTAPAEPNAPVEVRITLSGNLNPVEQRMLHEQSVARLIRLGFHENVGYDHIGFTRVRGSIPAKVVPTLVKDLRNLPAGWFAAEVPKDEADQPFRSVDPIRVVEVLPSAPNTSPTLPPDALPGKITPDARTVLATVPTRLELVLSAPLEGSSKDIRDKVRLVSPTSLIEGVAGNVVRVRVESEKEAEAIAKLPDVRHIRAPRAAAETVQAFHGAVSSQADWFARSNLKALHDRGFRGAGVKVVVLGSEFPGRETLLPKATFIDMTDEASAGSPPKPADATDKGAGIAAAVAAAAAAPDASFVLVRLDPTAFHQLLTIAKAATGDTTTSEGLRSRIDRLAVDKEALVERRKAVMAEYTSAAADLSDEPKSVKRRTDALAAVKKLEADETALDSAFTRLTAIKKALDDLFNAGVIINTLVWDSGRALDGLNPLQDVLEQRFVPPVVTNAIHPGRTSRPPIWIQAASGSVGSVWASAGRDADGNGVMEFAPPGAQLPPGTWTPELNFLSQVGPDGKATDTLAEGAKVRFTLQWREPQDPELTGIEPLFKFQIRLLRQVDPTGTSAATDELVEVAHSSAEPVRLYKTPTSGVYELTLDATVPAAGRYAVRVDCGIVAIKVIRARQTKAEVYPRIVVEAADAATAAKGRVTFATFAPTDPGAGVPADSHVALTVGTEEPGLTLFGAGPSMGLRSKPDFLARGVIEVNGKALAGPAVAAGYAGGLAASVRGTGVTAVTTLRDQLISARGKPIVLPKAWVETLPGK
jgi:hypothetical protein